MPKGKAIDVRPRKRKKSQRNDDALPTSTNGSVHENNNMRKSDGPRHINVKNRNTIDRPFTFESYLGCKFQKRMLVSAVGIIVCVLIIGFIANRVSTWYYSMLVTKPHHLLKVFPEQTSSERSQDLFWGTYRPGLYFGIRHRTPESLHFGVMWLVQNPENPRIRHNCDQHDGILSYNWLKHDGRSFGTEQIVDLYHIITISFIKPADKLTADWAVRISATARNQTGPMFPLTVIVYFYYPDAKSDFYMEPIVKNSEVTGLRGSTMELNDFHVLFHPTTSRLQQSYLKTIIPREDNIMQALYDGLGMRQDTKRITLIGVPRNMQTDDFLSNAWFYEVTVMPTKLSSTQINSVLEVEFTRAQRTGMQLAGDRFSVELDKRVNAFNERFQERFNIDLNKYNERQVDLCKIAVSNLLGGLGYFHGQSIIQSSLFGPDPRLYWPASLFTATPSRSNFPRGFLWDEGFHGLVLTRWDPQLAMETVGHWLDLMNANGWIPREQILGWEAKARVPSEFIVQSDKVANPPSLVLVIESLLDSLPKLSAFERSEFRRWSVLVLPRLHAWYQWFNTTQIGKHPLAYYWRGRSLDNIFQMNPLTLSSGLDDYPRESHPTDDARHLDLRCWMTLFARVVAKLATVVAQYIQAESPNGWSERSKLDQTRSWIVDYTRWADMLSDQAALDKLHWSEQFGRYADYGLHTDAVRLQLPKPSSKPTDQQKLVRVVDKQPTLQLVTSSFGYVNLFPLLLRTLAPTSPRLPQLLADLANKDLLWTDYGLRSIDPKSKFYAQSNTQDDPPYWRGAIWININYLAVQALRHYAHNPRTPATVAKTADDLCNQLSKNLVDTVLNELERTGFLWEQYNDETGQGQRGHPFSGWTSLISIIMSDM